MHTHKSEFVNDFAVPCDSGTVNGLDPGPLTSRTVSPPGLLPLSV